MAAYHDLPTPLTWLGDRGRDHARRPGPSKLPSKELASTLLHLLAGALNIVIIPALLDFVNILKQELRCDEALNAVLYDRHHSFPQNSSPLVQ